MSKEKIKRILTDLLFEEKEEIKASNYKQDILLWATYGTILLSINTTGAMNTIRPIGATICFGLLSIEAIDAIKTGKLAKDFKQVISNKQYRRVK